MSEAASTTIDLFLAAVCGDHDGPSPWSPDAVLDAVVPNWRLSCEGEDAVRAQLRSFYAAKGTLEELRRHPVAGGEIVELTVTWAEDGVPHAARQVHVLDIAADGRIARDEMWCGGRWSAALLAEMAAAG